MRFPSKFFCSDDTEDIDEDESDEEDDEIEGEEMDEDSDDETDDFMVNTEKVQYRFSALRNLSKLVFYFLYIKGCQIQLVRYMPIFLHTMSSA